MLNFHKAHFIAQVAVFSAVGFFVVVIGPIIRSLSGLPGGWVVLPIFISYLEILKTFDSSYPLWVGTIVGVIASFLPMMGGIGPISFVIGFISGVCAYFFNFEKYYVFKLVLSSFIMITIVSIYLGFFQHRKVMWAIYGLTSLISLAWSYLVYYYRKLVLKIIKKEVTKDKNGMV